MAKVKIYVSRDSNKELCLRDSKGRKGLDNIITEVQAGDEIVWVMGEGIEEIKQIRPVNGGKSIFREAVKKKDDGTWEGTVSESADGSEAYEIEYVAEGATARASRPKLVIKPPQ